MTSKSMHVAVKEYLRSDNAQENLIFLKILKIIYQKT